MKTVFVVALVILGCIFMACVLMMSPKGGIGLGIGGFSAGGGNEYGSKKSIEGKLKIIATITGILFVLVCAFMPFVA